MGVIKRGILGGFSGKVANVIGGEWKGIAYMRSQPLSVANPRTAGQVSQRNKFSGVVALASFLLAGIVKPLWDRFAQAQSGFNAFVSANIDQFDSNGDVDATGIVISRGSLTAVDSLTAGSPSGTTYPLTWTDNSGEGSALATDVAYAIIYNSTDDKWYFASGTARSSEALDVTFESGDTWGQADDRVILGFRRADGSQVSDSDNIQGFVI